MSNERAKAIQLSLLALLVFIAAVVASIHYAAQFDKINWRLVSLMCGVAFISVVIYRWNAQPNHLSTYDVKDLLMTNGKADIWKLAVMFFGGLSAWIIVQKVLDDPKGDITSLLTIVLGTFVSKEILGAFADALRGRAAPVDLSHDTNVNIGAGAGATPKYATTPVIGTVVEKQQVKPRRKKK